MNPRQRKGWGLLTVAVAGAIGVFFFVVAYVNDVEARVGDRVQTYVVTKQVQAYHEIPADAIEKVEIPKRWISDVAITDLNDLRGMVAAAAIPAGTQLQRPNLVPRPGLVSGQREIAMMVNAETGVAGKLRPGDRVDVWATFDQDQTQVGSRTKVIAQNLLVVDVGGLTQRQRQGSNGISTTQDAIPITFATEEGQIKALTFAESFAIEVRLALRPPTDETVVEPENKTYAETFPSTLPRDDDSSSKKRKGGGS